MATSSKASGARIRCRLPTSARIPSTWQLLEGWMRSYKPEELFDEDGQAASPS